MSYRGTALCRPPSFVSAKNALGETLLVSPRPSSSMTSGPRSPDARQKTFRLLHFSLDHLRPTHHLHRFHYARRDHRHAGDDSARSCTPVNVL